MTNTLLRALLAVQLLLTATFGKELLLSLDSRREHGRVVKLISFCVDCPNPGDEGSVIYGLLSRHAAMNPSASWRVLGSLVYCIPNLANSDKILNSNQLFDRIALVDRGEVPLHEKVRRMQNVGALAVIIADDGQCDENFHSCGPRAGSVFDGGFAAFDNDEVWASLTIPAYLVTKATADRLRSLMDLTQETVRGLGAQWIGPDL